MRLMRALRAWVDGWCDDGMPPPDAGVRCPDGAHRWVRVCTTVMGGMPRWEEYGCLRCGAWTVEECHIGPPGDGEPGY
jgi:hypothetical protein